MAQAELPHSSATYDDWRLAVEAGLKGRDFSTLRSRTRDGIVIEPLYERREPRPIAFARGSTPWKIIQPLDNPDPDLANDQARADVAGGATGFALLFADSGAATVGGLPLDADVLSVILDGVDLAAIHIRIEPHPLGVELAHHLAASVARGGFAPELTSISFGLDPLAGFMAERREKPPGSQDFVSCFSRLLGAGFRGPLITLDGRASYEAGVSEAHQLATILASATWWLQTFRDAGISAADTLPFFGASVTADCDQFLTIAKLRALRLLWARFLELCDAIPGPLHVHASTGLRMLLPDDPNGNHLRNVTAAFAAAVGGADSLLIHSSATGAEGRALARNVHHLLMQECGLHRVRDAASGSGALESMTDALCERAWVEFQEIERAGGIVTHLQRMGAAT